MDNDEYRRTFPEDDELGPVRRTNSGGARPAVEPPAADPVWVRWINMFSRGLAVPAGAAAALLMAHVIVDVASRAFFDNPLPSTIDVVANWWMVALVFLAVGHAQLRNDHIRATILTDRLTLKMKRLAEVGTLVLLAFLGVFLAYYGWGAAVESAQVGETVISGQPIPVWPFKFLVPLAGVSLALQCVATIQWAMSVVPDETHEAGVV